MTTRKILLMTCSAMLPLTAAQAQDSAAAGMGVEEIVVTARKTEERLQEAPISVAVVTAGAIDKLGFNSITDLARNRRPGIR